METVNARPLASSLLPPKRGFGFEPIGRIQAPRVSWIVQDVLPEKTLAFISAPAKEGKSTLALDLAICITTGRLFLGEFQSKRKKVLYFCLEDLIGEIKAKARHLLGRRHFPVGLLISKAPAVELPKQFEDFEADIKASKAEVVVLDTLRSAHVEEENSSTDMAPILNKFREITRSCGVTLIVIHHAGRKVESPDNPSDWLRGTSDINAKWEVLMGLKREAQSTKAYFFHKYRTKFDRKYEVVRAMAKDRTLNDYPIIALRSLGADTTDNLLGDEDLVIGELQKQPCSGNELEKFLKNKASRPRIDAACKNLGQKGKIHSEGRGRNSKWHVTVQLPVQAGGTGTIIPMRPNG